MQRPPVSQSRFALLSFERLLWSNATMVSPTATRAATPRTPTRARRRVSERRSEVPALVRARREPSAACSTRRFSPTLERRCTPRSARCVCASCRLAGPGLKPARLAPPKEEARIASQLLPLVRGRRQPTMRPDERLRGLPRSNLVVVFVKGKCLVREFKRATAVLRGSQTTRRGGARGPHMR